MSAFKPYRIDDMVKALLEQKKKHGNLLVEMSVDEEGNEFHPIGDYVTETKDEINVSVPFGIDGKKITIYPCQQ